MYILTCTYLFILEEGNGYIIICYILYYYTSEEFFLYKITVDKRTSHHFSWQNELLTGTFLTIALLQSFSAIWLILTSDWFYVVIQSKAAYVAIKCKER